MATRRWTGNAIAVKQIDTVTVSNTWAQNDTVTLTINGKDFVITIGTLVTTAQVATTIKQAFNGETLTDTAASCVPAVADNGAQAIGEFREVVATVSSSVVTFTGATAGKPVTMSSAYVTAGDGEVTAVTSVRAATGPNFFDNADNWSGATVPVDADAIRFDSGDVGCWYNISQATVTPASITVTNGYTGTIGLPEYNRDSTNYPYREYREQYLTLGDATDAGTITVTVGEGEGSGSGRIKISNADSQAVVVVRGTGQAAETGVPSFLWKGTHASNTFTITKGSAGIAYFGSETAAVATLSVGYITNQDSDSDVTCGSGVTLTTVNQNGGTMETNSAFTTGNIQGGELVHLGTGAVTTLNIDGGSVRYNSSGTLTTANVGSGGALDFRQDLRSKTVTNTNLYESSSYFDPFGVVTNTNGYDFVRTTPGGLANFEIVPHRTLTMSSI